MTILINGILTQLIGIFFERIRVISRLL